MDFKELAEKRNSDIPFAQDLGIKITDISEGSAKGEMEIQERHFNYVQSVHGGCLFSLADTIAGSAVASFGKRITTVSADMNYFAPMMGTGTLYAEAKVIKGGKTISVSEVNLYDQGRKHLAKGTFTFFTLS
ncbi:acyl-CoA thioesterase [Aequitasia blattaphilus]|uniref:PaaI family thioesterase n=1 Tax=Aequitasia blattaphilus TaxID=2949332 RepID=A0ABT1EGN0_9FIRM|nr:PaaI family thioesterase [Aequitasia blattaphilus]MCP1103612.1 PaaI family thioesterase [Aequitasia blattaphilus]MCR8616252.1 PaaI family thioesterase [Aequitasia blattaphilus]